MDNCEDMAATPRARRAINSDPFTETSRLPSHSSYASINTAQSSQARFPIDGHDSGASPAGRPNASQGLSPQKRSYRLSLLGSRFVRSSKRIISSRHTSSESTQSKASSIGKTIRRRLKSDSVREKIEASTKSSLRQSDCLNSHLTPANTSPALANPKVLLNSFATSSDSVWLVLDICCMPQTPLMSTNNPGQLQNLLLELQIPSGYRRSATLGHQRQTSMTVGSKWTVAMHLSREHERPKSKLALPFRASGLIRSATIQGRPTSHVLMDELQNMLSFAPRTHEQGLTAEAATVKLKFQHSLFPEQIVMSVVTASDCLLQAGPPARGGNFQRKHYGAGSLLMQQTRQSGGNNGRETQPGSGHADDPAVKNQIQTADSIVRLLHDHLKVTTPSEPQPQVERISPGDALNLLMDFDRAAGNDLPPVMNMDLKLLRDVFEKLLDRDRAHTPTHAMSPSRLLNHGRSRLRLSPRKSPHSETLPRPKLIKLNGPPSENRRNAMELDRETYDLGPVLRDLTNQNTRHGMNQPSLQSRLSRSANRHLNDDDVPAPLFSPRKESSKPLSTHGYGILERDDTWEQHSECSGVSTRMTREFGAQYDVESWRRDQLRQAQERGYEEAQDPAKAIWEKMRVSSDGSGFSDEDDERLQEMNLTSAPWM